MTGTLGDLKYSFLAPSYFRSRNGQGWVLADGGHDLQETYNKTWNETDLFNETDGQVEAFPDIRGHFLRSLNVGRDLESGDPNDPDGTERKLGSYQPDQIGKHRHKVSSDNDPFAAGGSNFKSDNQHGRDNLTQYEGGKETRPKNWAFYLYIKVFENE